MNTKQQYKIENTLKTIAFAILLLFASVHTIEAASMTFARFRGVGSGQFQAYGQGSAFNQKMSCFRSQISYDSNEDQEPMNGELNEETPKTLSFEQIMYGKTISAIEESHIDIDCLRVADNNTQKAILQKDAAGYDSDSVSSNEIQNQEEIIPAAVDKKDTVDLAVGVAVLADHVQNANLKNNDSNNEMLSATSSLPATENNALTSVTLQVDIKQREESADIKQGSNGLLKIQIEDKDVIDNLANNDNGDNNNETLLAVSSPSATENKNKSNLQQQSQIKEMTQEKACDNKGKDKNPESADDILKQHNVDLVNPAESKVGQPRLNKKDEVIDRMLDEVNLQGMEVGEEVKVEKNRVVKLKKTIEVRGENNKKKEELERLRQESRNLEDILLFGEDKDKQPLTARVAVGYLFLSAIPIVILLYLIYGIHTSYTMGKQLVEFIKKSLTI